MTSGALDASGPVVQSVDRALAVMEILGREGWVGVTEVPKEIGIHKSTAFRLLSTLERRGMVEQHGENQKYRLGFAVVRLAGSVRSALDLTRSARPVCEHLSEQTGETVNLAVLEGGEVVNIDQINLSPSVVSVNWLGRRTGLHTTSNGKVFLAWLPGPAREAILADRLDQVTPNTITDPVLLRQQLDAVRRDGYGYTHEELELGLNAVAAPIRGADGTVLATVCVSGPSYRLKPERTAETAETVIAAASEISRRLGHIAKPPASDAVPA